MLRVGLIGFGFMGRTHLECYRNNDAAEVVAVASRNPNRRAGKPLAGGNLPVGTGVLDLRGVRFEDDWRAVVADPAIELIDICAPTDLHAPIALAALAAGKHVVVEKPLARTLREAMSVVRAAKAARRLLHVGHVLRYWGQYVEARNWTQRTDMGEFRYGWFSRHGGRPGWTSEEWIASAARSGGVALDLAIHDMDAALWMFGPPRRIAVVGRLEHGLPMSMDATWFYPRGAQVQIHAHWDMQIGAPFRYAFELQFERGTLWCDSSQGAPLWLIQGGQRADLPFDSRSAYQLQIDEVVAAIQSGPPRTRVDPDSALQTMRLAAKHLRRIERFALTR